MNRFKIFATLLLLTAILAGCANTTSREHPDLEEHLLEVEKVVVAPVDINIQLLTFTGEDERMKEMEQEIGDQLITLINNALASSGYEVVEFDFDRAIKESDQFAFAVNQINESFTKARADIKAGLSIPEKNKRKFIASVGATINEVADTAGADAVLLVSYNGFKKSKGLVAKEMGAGMLMGLLTGYASIPTPSGATIEMALIDGISGEVLWTDTRFGKLDEKIATAVIESMPDDLDPIGSDTMTTEAAVNIPTKNINAKQ